MSASCPGRSHHLQAYLQLVGDFIHHCQQLNQINGYSKLEKKCRAERKFLKSLKLKSQMVQDNHLQSTNLNHYAAVLYMSVRLPHVSSVLRPFSVPSRTRGSLVVDVVCSHGLDWVKVIARKAQALHLVWAGQGQFGDRDLMGQAEDYLRCATQHPVNYIVPKVHFVFFNSVTQPMAETLTQLGIEVHGDVVPVGSETRTKLESVQEVFDRSSGSEEDGQSPLSEEEREEEGEEDEESTSLPPRSVFPSFSDPPCQTTGGDCDYSPSLQTDDDTLSSAIDKSMEDLKEPAKRKECECDEGCDCALDPGSRHSWLPFVVQKSLGLGSKTLPQLHLEKSSEPKKDEGFVSSHINRVNLDITTLITLVSAVSHGRCNFVFPEKILTMQAEEERHSPVLPRLVKFMEGKKLYCCETAISDFETILATLGGETERQRADDLLSRLEVIPDRPSERSQSLPVTGKLKERSKIIFGTGDHLQAITMTANTGYVRAAENHGVSFAVFPHASRALTEMKERTATPLKPDPPTNEDCSE